MGVLECINAGLKNGSRIFKAKMPTILSWLAVGGVWTTAALAAYETPEFMRRLAEEGLDDPEIRKERWLDVAKVTAEVYWPAFASGTATSAAIRKSDSESVSRIAALAMEAKRSDLYLSELKDKIVAEHGEKKLKELQDKIAQDHMDKDPPPEDRSMVHHTGLGLSLCKEPFSGQYIYTNYKEVYDCVDRMRQLMWEGDFVPVSEWLYLLHVRMSELSSEKREEAGTLGWTKRDLKDIFGISFGECRAPNGEPCNEIIFWREPTSSIGEYPFRY